MPSLRVSSHAAVAVLAACAVFPVKAGQFFIEHRPIEITQLTKQDVREFLTADWAKFDNKYVKDVPHAITGKMQRIEWDFQLTPPFPTTWPPQRHRSVTYYAYAEYQEATMHGMVASRSAPWAIVQLNEGMPATKTILASAIGPVVHGEGGWGMSIEAAARVRQITTDGAALLPDFVSWQAIPDNKEQVQAIREYYCQWALKNLTARLIKDNHREFFEWLQCPASTITEGLLYPLK